MIKAHEDTLELAVEALRDIGVSSSEHAMDKFSSEIFDTSKDDIEIPLSYGVDTIKCMSVNANKVYIYWELTRELLGSDEADLELLIKLFSDSDGVNELMSFFTTELVSSRFINIHIPSRAIYAVVGIAKKSHFVELMRSNSFTTPNDTTVLLDSEVWMDSIEPSKEIIRASYSAESREVSSFSMVKDLEFLHQSSKMQSRQNGLSSIALCIKD